VIKRTIYLIASARSRRIVGWHRKQSERDGILTELKHNCPGQYIGGKLVAEDDGKTVSAVYTPADLVVPEAYRDELDRLCRGW